MKWSNILPIGFVVIGLIAFFYVANRFSSGEKGVTTEKPITTCQPENAPAEKQKCYWTAHTHLTLKVIENGQEVALSFEKGDLQKSHTHAEKDKIHWHATLPVDPKTKQTTDYSALKLKAVLDEFKINYQGKKTTVLVNGQEKKEGVDYVWQDGDTIEVTIGE